MRVGAWALDPPDQRGVARGRVGDAPGVLGRMHREVQVIAGDVQAERRGLGHFGTLPCGTGLPPSLARCGLAPAALATVATGRDDHARS